MTKKKHRFSSGVRIPPVDECLQLMEHHEMMPHIRRHSLTVARLAAIMGMVLNDRGARLSIPLIIAGSLLHDIAKTRSLREGGNHVEMGRRMVLEMGYPEVAWIVGSHVDPGPRVAEVVNEATLVNYADKRVLHDRVVPLKERLEDLMARYGKTAENRARIEEMAKNIERLENTIFSRMSLSPDDLESIAGSYSLDSLFEDRIREGEEDEKREIEGH